MIDDNQFQSYNSSIKTSVVFRELNLVRRYFNPTIVRLKLSALQV